MMTSAIKIHLPNFDEWQVGRNGKSVALPYILTVHHAGVLITDQNLGLRDLRMRAAARDKRPRQRRDNAEWNDSGFHGFSLRGSPISYESAFFHACVRTCLPVDDSQWF